MLSYYYIHMQAGQDVKLSIQYVWILDGNQKDDYRLPLYKKCLK